MNTRPSRSLFREFINKSIGSLAKFFCIHNTPKRGGGPYSSGCRSFFIDAGQSSEKNEASLVVEKNRRVHAI